MTRKVVRDDPDRKMGRNVLVRDGFWRDKSQNQNGTLLAYLAPV